MPLTTEKTDLDSLVSQIGEVSINPTLYTTNERLKQIELNTSSIAINNKIGIGFAIANEITRPNNVIPYTSGDIINNSGTTMPYFDFTSYGVASNAICKIDEIILNQDNTTTAGQYNYQLYFWQSATLGSQVFTDNSPFNPSYADCNGRYDNTYFNTLPIALFGLTSNYSTKVRVGDLNVSTELILNKLYYTLICSNTATPVANTKFNLILKGRIF
jgi:hypothetical protein